MAKNENVEQGPIEFGRRGLLRRVLSRGGLLVGALLAGTTLRPATVPAADAAPVMLKNIGLCVSDIERSRLFYTEVFGFKADPEPQKIGKMLGGLLELENLDLTIHFLNKQGVRLELLHYASPGTLGDGTRHPMNQLGLSHLAFEVTNIDSVAQAVAHMGGQVLEQTRLGAPGKTAAMMVTDPDGTRIELIAV
tara:strand:+ start:114 stop:692 length:579 start_codon:yes stop_codon:yes gene_type:complete